jgi:hypothetical protein
MGVEFVHGGIITQKMSTWDLVAHNQKKIKKLHWPISHLKTMFIMISITNIIF